MKEFYTFDWYEKRGSLQQELYIKFSEIESINFLLKSKLINEYGTNLIVWKDKISRTKAVLEELQDEKLRQFDKSVEIKYPNDKSLIQLKSDAQILLSYLNKGNSFSGLFFHMKKTLLPKNIKEKLYFIDAVKVNGSPCDTIAEFETVLEDIKIKQDFEELKTIWEVGPNGNSKSYFDKVKFYGQIKADTESLIDLLAATGKIREQIESLSSIKIQDYLSSKVHNLIEDVDFNFLLAQARVFKAKILKTNNLLSIQNIHPIANKIKKAVEDLDIDKYEQYLAEIDILNSEKHKYSNYIRLQDDLHRFLPVLVKEVLENSFDFSNFRKLENAIHFKHAFAEIEKLLAEDYERLITQKLLEIERYEEKLISTVASKKAWCSVIESLGGNPNLKRHLNAFAAFAKKGKGKGKRAMKFRKDIQEQMQNCRDSVPCWIMPLYKVAETIIPEEGMFDYVIIDESSQLGPDAIFLMYIAKKIIIVGDDKQISPEDVGVEANKMTPYIEKYLKDFPLKNCFQPEFSFFDFAKIFCNGMTVLREHFRCMPEIIEFCNKLFYAPDGKGLYPLKQYSENRLRPLETVYCQNGYIDGTYQNISNRIEAERIADKIVELVDDGRYKGKTFGVITLQGNKQASIVENFILKKIGEVEFKKRNIVCGTSASFQGDERDIIFLSLITANNHKRMALGRPEDERRFNVAVSRAKEQVWLFHSVQLDDFSNTNDLRYKLLDHFLNYEPQAILSKGIFERTIGTQPEPFESWFEVDVYNDIVTNNYSVIPQYEVAKGRYRIDLVTILSNGIKIAIECDGDKFHGPEQFQNDLLRQKVLERCGWQFFRVRGAEYYSNRKKALEPLWKILRTNDLQIEEPTITNNNGHNEQEEIKNEVVVEAVQPPIKKQTFQYNNKVVQPDLFPKENQVTMTFKSEKETEHGIETTSNLFSCTDILVFSSLHNVYKIRNRGMNNKAQVISEIEFEEGEKPIYLAGTINYSGYLIVAFQNGKAGKIAMTSFQTEHNRKKLKNAFNNESKLIFIEQIESDIDLVALSNINKVVLFNTSQINAVESRTTKGVQVMKQRNNSIMSKVKKLNQVKLQDAEYYRKHEGLNVVGYFLKHGDEI